MIYAVMQPKGETLPALYTFKSWSEYRAALRAERNGNRNQVKVFRSMSTEITRTGYRSEKAQAYNILLEFSYLLSIPGLSMGEMQKISDHAERIARRYGHLEEARENAVC
jgi:hypothetical protein